jgi:hypothetical protein
MFELFLNPANVLVGGALISAPIMIHLINRMRYRRVRWAAMEFLLRSQKRNRRRLIIEQLILLFLRILLVALTALLVARFLGFSWAGFQPKNTLHVVVFDDRLSTADFWKNEEGEVRNCFLAGKQLLLRELTQLSAQARSPQRVAFLWLSDPSAVVDIRLDESSLRELEAELARRDAPTLLHLDLAKGVRAASEVFAQSPHDLRFLHVVSDFRRRHWAEPDGAETLAAIEQLTRTGVRVNLIDAAHPVRGENEKTARAHDNLAVTELRPETRVAAEGMPVQFRVTVTNYSRSQRDNVRVTVKVEGVERPEGSLTMLNVKPGPNTQDFQVAFTRLGYNEVSANLENEEAGLQADNTRYAVVEVRRQVPVLLADGDPSGGDKPGGDAYHVRALLTAARGFDVVRGGVGELERPNLARFACIYLLNVREVSERAQRNLEDYVRGGGGVAFFLGDRVNADFYTKRLYADGKGIFPVPLAERPSAELSDEEKQERQIQTLTEPRAQVYFRNPQAPVVAELADPKNQMLSVLRFLSIDRHWPVPRARWNFDPARVEELATLPNNRPVTDYQAAAQDLLDALPIDDPQQTKYHPALEHYRRKIRDTLTGKSLYPLVTALDDLLDQGGEASADRPSLKEFWEQNDAKVRELRQRVERFRERVRYGDPLLVSARYGKGRAVACLTSAGRKWNDWAGGGPASVTYPVFMLDLQKYLAGADVQEERLVGAPLEVVADNSRYEARAHCFLERGGRQGDGGKPAEGADTANAGMKDLGELQGSVTGDRLTFHLDRTSEPGVYHLQLTERADSGGEPRTDSRAFAVNVDAEHESDLSRAGRDELERVGRLSTPAAGTIADLIGRPSDLSESAWFYLLFLAVLVAEQALAVHLSFHLRGDAASQVVRPQATAA